jgi:hypoxanthine phosphoribosyltransferase
VLFDGAAIHKRLDEMAAQITADYPERELTVIAILTGRLMFMSDLLRRIPLPLKLDCLSLASYHGETQTSSEMIFKQLDVRNVAGRDILILDDILESGHTLAVVRKSWRGPNRAAFRSVCCGAKVNSARGRLMRIISALKSTMNLSSVTGSTSRSDIATCHTLACLERNC